MAALLGKIEYTETVPLDRNEVNHIPQLFR